MHISVMVEKMNRMSLGENDRVLSNLAIFVNRPIGYRQGQTGPPPSFIRAVTVTYWYTCCSDSGWFAGKRTSGPDPRCAALFATGRIAYRHVRERCKHIESWRFSTETTVYHRFRSVLRLFILDGKQRAPENVG
jgi:hypothetical protein